MPVPASRSAPSLRVAIPKGRMEKSVFAYIQAAGYAVPRLSDDRQLTLMTEDGRQEYILAKPLDVPTFVAHGIADIGFVGLENLREGNLDVLEPFTLPLGAWRLALAGFPTWRNRPLPLASRLRVATKYPRIASEFFVSRGISAEIIKLYGSVELAPLTGLADLILDIVETGRTLRANGLVELHTVMACHMAVIVNRSAYCLKIEAINRYLQALRPRSDSEPVARESASSPRLG